MKIHCEYWGEFSLNAVAWSAMHVRRSWSWGDSTHRDTPPSDTATGRKSAEGAAATPRHQVGEVYYMHPTPPGPNNIFCFANCELHELSRWFPKIFSVVSCRNLSVGQLICCGRKVLDQRQTASLQNLVQMLLSTHLTTFLCGFVMSDACVLSGVGLLMTKKPTFLNYAVFMLSYCFSNQTSYGAVKMWFIMLRGRYESLLHKTVIKSIYSAVVLLAKLRMHCIHNWKKSDCIETILWSLRRLMMQQPL